MVRSSCKLPPGPKARMANTRCGLANLTPVERILFFLTPRPKMPHFRFFAGREWDIFGPVWPSVRVAIYTCSGVALSIPMLRIRFFIIPWPKIPHSRFEAGSESGTFEQDMVKNFFLSSGLFPSVLS